MKLSNLLLGVALTVSMNFGASALQGAHDEIVATTDFLQTELNKKVNALRRLVGGSSFKRDLTSQNTTTETVYKKTTALTALSRLKEDIEGLVKLLTVLLIESDKLAAALTLVSHKVDSKTADTEDSGGEADDDNSDQA